VESAGAQSHQGTERYLAFRSPWRSSQRSTTPNSLEMPFRQPSSPISKAARAVDPGLCRRIRSTPLRLFHAVGNPSTDFMALQVVPHDRVEAVVYHSATLNIEHRAWKDSIADMDGVPTSTVNLRSKCFMGAQIVRCALRNRP
jgi:hypothetical protein